MELIKTLLEQQPLMALFLTIAIGYLVGRNQRKGFSLGVGAVLFVALAMGWFAPKSVPSAMVGTLGLAFFLYGVGVGVQYGTQFFIGLTSRGGLWANMIALTGVLAAGAVSLAFMKMMDLKLGHALGLFAGSGTSAATLQAAVATLGNDDPHSRLLGRLPVRRGRADPVPLHRLHLAQAEEDRRAAPGGPQRAGFAQPGHRRKWRAARDR